MLREILVNFLFTASALSFLAFLATALIATYRIPGAPPSIVIGYVPILVMYIFPYLLPVSLMIGVVLSFGRLSAENEITAMRAGGVHLGKMLVPSLFLGLVLAIILIPLVHEVIPRFHYQKGVYLREATGQLIRNLNPSLRSIGTGSSFHLEWAGRRGPYFEDLYLFMKRGEEGQQEKQEIWVHADRGLIELDGEYLLITLWGSSSLLKAKEGATATDVSSERMSYRVSFDEIAGARKFSPTKDSECSSVELATKLKRDRASEPLRTSYELQRRTATVFSGVLFAAVGIPIGIFLRRGTRLSAFVTAFLTVLCGYYPIVYFMEMLGKEQWISPTIAAWTANAWLALIGAILLRKLFRI